MSTELCLECRSWEGLRAVFVQLADHKTVRLSERADTRDPGIQARGIYRGIVLDKRRVNS